MISEALGESKHQIINNQILCVPYLEKEDF